MLTLTLAAHLLLGAGPAVVTIEVKPPDSEVLVDGAKKGKGDKPIVVKLKAGKHVVRVVHKGDAHEEELEVKAGEKKTWKWEFTGVEPSKGPELPTSEE